MRVQPWNVRTGVHISPRYPTMRNRRIVVTNTYVEWEEGADEPTRTVRNVYEHPCEPDAEEVQEGLYTACHVAAHAIRRTYYASLVEGEAYQYAEVYDHPYHDLQEVAELELRGFRPDEVARVEKLVTWVNGSSWA